MAIEVSTARPVVLIGAGGTGKQALLFLRRMFFERYGVTSLPHVGQVVIDTDPAEKHLDGRSYDEFDREIAFDKEMLVTPVGEALKNIRNNRSQYPHIDSWLDRALEQHGDIRDGAGQIRSFGRLAFYQHYHAIRKQLEDAYRRVTDDKVGRESLEKFKMNVAMSEGVDTWLIFSVAGGTGSGMFLDLAFLAKRVAEMHGGGPSRSIILLPTAFTSNLPAHHSSHPDHRPFANSYAALMELETYNFERSQEGDPRNLARFPAQWTQELFEQKHYEVGPVFDKSWLIDNESLEGGGQLNGERMALCHMMAEWLFLRYGSTAEALAGQIRSNQSNDAKVVVPLANVKISHPGPTGAGAEDSHSVTLLYSRRYCSFGLSKIYIPTANIASQAYARLVGDIASLWLEAPRAGDPRRSLARVNADLLIPDNPEVRGFPAKLARELSLDSAREPLSRSFERLVHDKHQQLKNSGFEPGSETDARDWFSREIMAKLLDAAAAGSRRGELSKVVNPQNVRLARERIIKVLDDHVAQTLRTPGERLQHAEETLKFLAKDYGQLAQEAKASAEQNERTGKRLQDEIEKLLVWAPDHRGFDRSTIFEAAFGKMRERAAAELRRQALLAAALVAEEIATHIGESRTVRDAEGKELTVYSGMLQTLSTLRETLQLLKRRAADRIQALRQQPISPLNSRAPAAQVGAAAGPEAELDQIYQDEDGHPIERESVEKYEEKMYVDLGDKGFTSPWHLRGPADSRRVQKAFDDMLGFAQRELKHLPDRMEDAILHFRQRFSREGVEGHYEAELKRVAARGTPWLPRFTHHVAGGEFKDRDVAYYLACSENADPDARADLLERFRERTAVSGSLDTVYFEGEVAGVPLFAVRHMDRYRNAYIGYQGAADPATRVVHTELDLEKYVDLLPYTSEEMEHRSRAVRTFIRGLVAGVIVPIEASSGGAVEWQFIEQTRTSARPVARRLGRFRTAIQTLAEAGSPLCTALVREVDAKYTQQIQHEDLGRIYCAIEEMNEKPPVASTEWSSAAVSILAEMRRKHGVEVEGDARAAQEDLALWGDAVAGTGEHPFWRVKALVSPPRPG